MADRNLVVRHRGGTYTVGNGMVLEVPPSGFDFRTAGGPRNDIDPFTDDHAIQRYPLGTMLRYGDRWFRYVLAGGSSLVAGNVIGAKAVISGHTDETVVLTAGENTLAFTPSGTNITANEYQDGYVSVLSGTGKGYSYRILSHPAETSQAAFTITLVDPVVVTGASTPKATLIQSPYGEVIQSAVTTRVGQSVGVACAIVTLAQYGWIQSHGAAAVLLKGTSIIGNDLVVPTATAGAVGPRTTALVLKENVVARAMEVSTTDGDTIQVYITIE